MNATANAPISRVTLDTRKPLMHTPETGPNAKISPVNSSGIDVEVIDSVDGLDSIATDWASLQDRCEHKLALLDQVGHRMEMGDSL